MRYLFACGCPRSGTTVLWRLLRESPKIAMGVERYIDLVLGKQFALTEDHFKKDRFFTHKAEDTHFPDITSGGAGEYYAQLKEYYDDCKYYGDKIPPLFERYDEIFANFPKAHVIYIYRNIFDVAQSYIKRLNNPDDAWDKGIDKAIAEWNQSMRTTLAAKEKGHRIFCLEYEELFFEDYNWERVFDLLEIKYTKKVKMKFRNEKIFCNRLEDKRENFLSSMDKSKILKQADFEAYNKIVAIKNSF